MWITAEVLRGGDDGVKEDVSIQPWDSAMQELHTGKLSYADQLHKAIDVLLEREPLIGQGHYFEVRIHA